MVSSHPAIHLLKLITQGAFHVHPTPKIGQEFRTSTPLPCYADRLQTLIPTLGEKSVIFLDKNSSFEQWKFSKA